MLLKPAVAFGLIRRAAVMASVMSLAAAGLVSGASGATVNAGSDPAAPGSASNSANCPDGFTSVPAESSTPISGGGVVDRYDVNGTEMDVPVAPSTFQPLLATDGDLAAFGVPPRPRSSESRAEWTSLMSAWRWAPDAGLCVGPEGLTFSSHINGSWSGMVASAGSTTWNTVAGWFTQPSFNSAGCSSSSEASWVGLGGYGSPDLVQDGTYMEQGPRYWAFYEYLNLAHSNPPITLSSVSVNPGNVFYSYVFFQSSTSKVEFYVQNETNGTHQTVWLSNASSYYDGHAVDFIDERPWISLPNFSSIPWSNAGEGELDGSWHNLGDQSPSTQIMETGSTLRAEPGGMLTSTSFKDYWYHC